MMAAKDDLKSYIDNRLDGLASEVGEDLRLVAGHWDGMDEGTRTTLKLEWINDMHTLEGLEEHYRRGEMDDAQARLYTSLKDALEENLPIARRMGLAIPDVSFY